MEFGELFNGLPSFLAYFGLGLGLLVAFFFVYLWVTPHDELRLIRAGNAAAAISLGGAALGFIIPLAIVIAKAKLGNVVLWGIVAIIVQVLAFFLARALLPNLSKSIEEGKVSVGAFAGVISLTIGILNAACQTD